MGAVAFVETLFPPFPGDVLFVVLSGWAAGSMASVDPFVIPALCGFSGCFAASVILILAGARLGRGRVRAFLESRVGAGRLERTERLVSRRSALILVVSRFMPGIRSLLVLVAGYSGVGAGRASLFGGISALSWYLLMSVVGVELGYNLQALESLMSRYEIIVWAAFAAMAAAWAVNRALGRRRLAG
jgi:membrane protein DedA with SNARE-associated domain